MGIDFESAGRKMIPRDALPGLRTWREVGYINRRGGGVKKEVLPQLASELLASAAHTQAGTDLLRVNVYLTSPTDLLDRKSTRLNSSHSQISYAVFCLKKKKTRTKTT